MLGSEGFDLWADGYDRAVGVSDDENSYPFAGYREVLEGIFRIITERKNASVLDIGFGTGTLTERLYRHGCSIHGQDFSSKMIETASRKMPGAHLCQGDFTEGLAEELRNRKYDFIVATYSLHHLTDERKTVFLQALQDQLNDGGMILIGDVAFQTREAMDRCRLETGDAWDDGESYFAVDELKKDFPELSFVQVSFCAGILILPRSVSGKPSGA